MRKCSKGIHACPIYAQFPFYNQANNDAISIHWFSDCEHNTQAGEAAFIQIENCLRMLWKWQILCFKTKSRNVFDTHHLEGSLQFIAGMRFAAWNRKCEKGHLCIVADGVDSLSLWVHLNFF